MTDDSWDGGYKSGEEVGRKVGHKAGYMEGFDEGFDEGREEGYEAGQAAFNLSDYTLGEFLDVYYQCENETNVQNLVKALKEEIGNSPFLLEQLQDALDYHFGDRLK